MFVCLYEAVKKMIHVCNTAKITFQQYYTNELIQKIEKRNKNRSQMKIYSKLIYLKLLIMKS